MLHGVFTSHAVGTDLESHLALRCISRAYAAKHPVGHQRPQPQGDANDGAAISYDCITYNQSEAVQAQMRVCCIHAHAFWANQAGSGISHCSIMCVMITVKMVFCVGLPQFYTWGDG